MKSLSIYYFLRFALSVRSLYLYFAHEVGLKFEALRCALLPSVAKFKRVAMSPSKLLDTLTNRFAANTAFHRVQAFPLPD